MSDPQPQSRRGLARRLTVQALYQWLINENTPAGLVRQFREQKEGLGRADPDYFEELLSGVVERAADLTVALVPYLDRPISQLDPVEHAVLLLGAYELSEKPEVPWKVVVNESVNLAKMFGAEDGFKFVNGVLDKLAHQVRPHEVGR
ncbi:transcription antitermination factor NusB [Sinimarinibacterium sp. CAU 1509]|uniref:transcription antitermination factor NusB n=1 Tax=Sinimarinibacterium sp. CAU 1509 TaxID=2562283 RepID=UPI0010AC1177|nr:transcription antitermination factor NusB [Sinimarinibacterium sp. CAU 1509]TJY60871.1 transcription antitermination factor NusB [Sinimarinibacterium sp. CAU 1509]